MPLTDVALGERVVIHHQGLVNLYGCRIGDGALVGIQAVVLNGAQIGRNCLVGAGALVTEGKEFPDGMLILGSPAKAVRALTPDEIARLQRGTQTYVERAQRYRSALKRIG